MDTARAERHRSSRAGRRGEMRPQPSRCLQERRQKEMAARSARLLSDRGRAASVRESLRRAEFAPSDSYRGRHDDHAWCTKFESALHHRTETRAVMGDFGPWNGETRTRTGDTTISGLGSKVSNKPRSLHRCSFSAARHDRQIAAACEICRANWVPASSRVPNRFWAPTSVGGEASGAAPDRRLCGSL